MVPSEMQHGYSEFCAHETFEQQAERSPHTPALIFDGRQITYAELNRRSNQLARYFARRGVGPEVAVAVCLPPSLDPAIAALAVLKAGGVCVLLPRGYPKLRLEEMVRDAGPRVLLTTSQLAGRFDAGDSEVICLDRIAAGLPSESEANPRSGVTPDNAAYIRFTSGSTGSPKGVVNIHRSLTSRLFASSLPDIQAPDIHADDVCSLNTSLGLTLRLLMPLALGATVAILKDEDTTDATQFVHALERNGITSVFLAPSLLRQVLALDQRSLSRIQSLRAVTVTGEALGPDLARRFLEMFPNTLLIDVYGSNETGGAATMRILRQKVGGRPNSIGRPVANTRVHILDEHMRPVAPGVTGEIYIGSGHLARGYLNRPDLTAQSFLPDPFGEQGARLYRTGDLGRYCADGEIEFLGRRDHQVKIRGFRVELQEVEAALRMAPEVQDVAVTVQSLNTANRLVAYVVGKAGASLAGTQLRRFLENRLPAFMRPAVYIFLPGMPLTPMGKVDRRALPPPEAIRPNLDNPYEAPRTPVEAQLADMWASMLNLDRVGIHDDFLELGGDSLAAAELSSQICDRFGLKMSKASLFEKPTVAGLAARIGSAA